MNKIKIQGMYILIMYLTTLYMQYTQDMLHDINSVYDPLCLRLLLWYMTFIIDSITMRWSDSSDNIIWFTVLHFYISIIIIQQYTITICGYCHLQFIIVCQLLTSTRMVHVLYITATIKGIINQSLVLGYQLTHNTSTTIVCLPL